MQDGQPFGVAGIWENWKRFGTEDWMRTFAVITCPANELVTEIHDRMPLIIPPESADRWLGTLDPNPIDLLAPYPAPLPTMWPISTRVNKPDDDVSILDVNEP
jgi:putative SOS response-associated peptidase YedK